MKIVHVASECAPIAKVGGLGDVVYGLAKAQEQSGASVEIILPNYELIDQTLLEDVHQIEPGVISAKLSGISLTLIGQYDQIYGGNETARFVQFCSQVKNHLSDFDILHLHDWPVCLLAPLIKQTHPDRPIVLSVHNAHHQGHCSQDVLDDIDLLLGDLTDPRDPNRLNLLKGGLIYSDAIVAVSPKYAEEILSENQGDGLEGVFNEQKHKLSGILNGIDTDYWDSETDPYLVYHYPRDDVESGKKANRKHLEDELQIQETSGPLVCAITRLVPQKGLELIEEALIYTLEHNGNFVLLGSSPDLKIQTHWENLAKTYASPHLHCHFEFDEKLAHMLYSASDLIVIPSLFEPCGLTQIIAMRYGTVPLVRCTGGLADTVFHNQNGFTFDDPTPDALILALDQAFDIYSNDKPTWNALIASGSTPDYSWKHAAKAYKSLYKSIR